MKHFVHGQKQRNTAPKTFLLDGDVLRISARKKRPHGLTTWSAGRQS